MRLQRGVAFIAERLAAWRGAEKAGRILWCQDARADRLGRRPVARLAGGRRLHVVCERSGDAHGSGSNASFRVSGASLDGVGRTAVYCAPCTDVDVPDKRAELEHWSTAVHRALD